MATTKPTASRRASSLRPRDHASGVPSATPHEFGAWFGVQMHGQFRPQTPRPTWALTSLVRGLSLGGHRRPHRAGAYFSFRWHPFAVETESTTRPSRRPSSSSRSKRWRAARALTIVESGFDAFPPHAATRRFRMNDGGWTAQVANIEQYVRRRTP